jgi:hypothetical protein
VFVIYFLHLVFVMLVNPAGLDQILKYPVLTFRNGSSSVLYTEKVVSDFLSGFPIPLPLIFSYY